MKRRWLFRALTFPIMSNHGNQFRWDAGKRNIRLFVNQVKSRSSPMPLSNELRGRIVGSAIGGRRVVNKDRHLHKRSTLVIQCCLYSIVVMFVSIMKTRGPDEFPTRK